MINYKLLDDKQDNVLSSMSDMQLQEGIDRIERLLNAQIWGKTTESGMIKAQVKLEKELEKRGNVK